MPFVCGLSVRGSPQTSSYVIAASVGSSRDAALPAISDTADEPILSIKKRVDEVNVLFIATDRHGKFARNLNQNDFSIFDDHKPVHPIINFPPTPDLPTHFAPL